MTLIANIDFKLRHNASRCEGTPATAGYRRLLVVRMDAVFHGVSINQSGWENLLLA